MVTHAANKPSNNLLEVERIHFFDVCFDFQPSLLFRLFQGPIRGNLLTGFSRFRIRFLGGMLPFPPLEPFLRFALESNWVRVLIVGGAAQIS